MEYSYRRLFSFLKQFLWPYKWRIFIASILSAINSAAWLYNAYAFALVVNFVVAHHPGDPIQPLYRIFVTWLTAMVISYVAGFLSKNIARRTAEQADANAQVTAIEHLSHIDIAWHEKENAGNKIKRIQRGAQGIVDMMTMWNSIMIAFLVSFFGALYIISRFDKILVLLLIVYQIIYYCIATFARRRGVRAIKQANIHDEQVTGLFFEIVANIRSVKVLGMAKKVLEYSQPSIREMLRWINRRIFWFQGAYAMQGIWDGIARISLTSFIVWNIFEGRYDVGFLVLFIGYFNTLSHAISQLSEIAQDLASAKSNVGRLTDILDQPILIDNEEGKVDFPHNWKTIQIRNLSFTYGDNAVLSNIDLDIKKGEKIGIVGLSGAGKSTIFKLLLKEYEDYEGSILVGEVSLKMIKKSSYVRHIAAVLQDTEVFNMSLHKNVVLANDAESENKELFERALNIAHIVDFLPKLPLGVETMIGEKGVKLSGGEKQRLGIARAVFKSPEILFLDEATSHLDVESEQKIQDSLKKFFKDVTAVVIAHRLSTIREMDRIIVLQGGKIIESGTFDELHAQSGRFREFWDKQRK